MVSIHGPLGNEPNTLTSAPLRSCNMLQWLKLPHIYLCISRAASDVNSHWFLAPCLACWIRYMRSSFTIHGGSPFMLVASPATLDMPTIAPGPVASWIRRWSSEPKIAGSSPARVIFLALQTGFPLAVPFLQSTNSAIGNHSQNAASEDRTHDLRIMRPTRC